MSPYNAKNPYDEVNMFIERLTAAWGSVAIACDDKTCAVSDGSEDCVFEAATLLEALRKAVVSIGFLPDSFRADAATVRRAVLLTDLAAMCEALSYSDDLDEQHIADMLHIIADAIKYARIDELGKVIIAVALRWRGHTAREETP